MENLEEKAVMTEEAALIELGGFLKEYLFETLEDKRIRRDYPQVLSALISGNLVFKDGTPEYKFKEPIRTNEGEIDLASVVFKTRISVFEKESLARKNDLREDPLGYSYSCMAHVMQLRSKAYLSKMGRYDLKVCEQLSTLFV